MCSPSDKSRILRSVQICRKFLKAITNVSKPLIGQLKHDQCAQRKAIKTHSVYEMAFYSFLIVFNNQRVTGEVTQRWARWLMSRCWLGGDNDGVCMRSSSNEWCEVTLKTFYDPTTDPSRHRTKHSVSSFWGSRVVSQFQFEISGLWLIWCHRQDNYYLHWPSVRREGGTVNTASLFLPPQEREGGFPSLADNMINVHSFSLLLITTKKKKKVCCCSCNPNTSCSLSGLKDFHQPTSGRFLFWGLSQI